MSRNTLIRAMSAAFHHTGMSRLVGMRYAGLGCIFNFHSVVRDRAAFLNDPMHLQVGFLAKLLDHYRRARCDIIAMDEVIGRLRNPNGRRFVAFTFDDGYRDNLTLALPVFESFDAPMTVYVTTDMVERRLRYWWGGLRELIKQHDDIVIDALGERISARSLPEKKAAYLALCERVRSAENDLVPVVDQFLQQQGVSSERLLEEEALSADDVRALGRHPLVTVGGHTVTHAALSKLSTEDARSEMADNKRFLEDLCQQPVLHFAYPYGSEAACGGREFELAAEVGFETAVTTCYGTLFAEHAQATTAWPRVAVDGDRDYLSFLEFQRHGVVRALKSRFGAPTAAS